MLLNITITAFSICLASIFYRRLVFKVWDNEAILILVLSLVPILNILVALAALTISASDVVATPTALKMNKKQLNNFHKRRTTGGSDYGYAIARKEAEVLVEALNELKDDVNLIHQFALKAYEQGQAE